MIEKLKSIEDSLGNNNPKNEKIEEIKPLFAYITVNTEQDKADILKKWRKH